MSTEKKPPAFSPRMNKPPQLTRDELHQLKWLLGAALALFSTWTVFYLEVDAWTLLVLNTVAIVATLIWPTLPDRVPRWMHAMAFPVIVAVFLGDVWFTAQVLPPMVRLDLMLIFYRTISYRQRRDDLQLIVLGLFLVVVAGVLTVSLAFAAQILVFTACALALLFIITLVDAAEAKDPPARTPLFTWGAPLSMPSWVPQADWPHLLRRVRAVIDWRVAVLAAVLFAGVVAVSGLLFLAIPRFQLENSLFLDRFMSKKAKTGFSDNIRFGDVTEIITDTSIALSVDLSDPRDLPATLYLRMIVLDQYEKGRFKLSSSLRRMAFQPEKNTATVRGTERAKLGEPVFWTFYFEAGVSRYLPLPGSFELARFRELQNVSASPQLRALALRNEPVTMTAYRLEGVSASPLMPDPEFAERLKTVPADPRARLRRTALMQLALPGTPADEAALRRAVAEIAGGSDGEAVKRLSPMVFAQRACAWLAQRHAYSMQSTLPAGEADPLVRWIDSREPGHCELFAGAFVVLARAAGFPTRLVSGFKGGTWNAYSNNLTVRNSDAHAWCEMWNGTDAWMRVDPTPGSTAVGAADELKGAAALAQRLDRSWSARFDSLRVFWYRRIVNFDQRSQLDTLRAVKAATQQSGQRLRLRLEHAITAAKTWLASPWNVRRIANVVGVGAAVAILGWGVHAVMQSWRWGYFRRRGGRNEDPVRLEAGRWLRRIADRGSSVALRAEEDTLRILRRSASDGGHVADWRTEEETEVKAELQRLRYGARATWPEPEKVFRKARRVWRERRRKVMR